MREILFKGISKYNKKWIEGDLVHDAFDGTSMNMKVGIKKTNCYPVEVHPSTVCQFTGLLDSKGERIFEGDIDEYGDIVRYKGYGFYLTDKDTGWKVRPARQDMTITGSIHDKDKS